MAVKRIKFILVLAFSLSVFLFSGLAKAQEKVPGETVKTEAKEEGFDVTETILDHIKDEHSWHLWGHSFISLPVILHTDKGFETFSSSVLTDERHEPVV